MRYLRLSLNQWWPPKPTGSVFANGPPLLAVSVTNPAPQASAQVTLDAAASDPDGDPVTLVWTIVSAPNTSTATLGAGSSSAQKLFTPDVIGNYLIRCVASDDGGAARGNTSPTVLSVTKDTTLAAQAAPDVGLGGEAAAKAAVGWFSGNNPESAGGSTGAVSTVQAFEADLGRTIKYSSTNFGGQATVASTYTNLSVSNGIISGSLATDDTCHVTAQSGVGGTIVNGGYFVVGATGGAFRLSIYKGGAAISSGNGTISLAKHTPYGASFSTIPPLRDQFTAGIGISAGLGRADVEMAAILYIYSVMERDPNTGAYLSFQGQSPPLAYRRTRRADVILGRYDATYTSIFNLAHITVTGITGVSGTGVFTKTAHGIRAGAKVKFTSLTGGSSLSTSTVYRAVNVTANTFQLATTLGGAAITSLGSTVTAATAFVRNDNFRIRFSHEGDLAYPGGYPDGRFVSKAGDPANQSDQPITGLSSTTATNSLSGVNHGFVNDQQVKVTAVGTSGLTLNGIYYITGLGFSANNNDFKLAATRGGSAVSVTTSTGISIAPQDEADMKAALHHFYTFCNTFTIPIECDYGGDGPMFSTVSSLLPHLSVTDTREAWQYGAPDSSHTDVVADDIYQSDSADAAYCLHMVERLVAAATSLGKPWAVPELGSFLVSDTASGGAATSTSGSATVSTASAHGLSSGQKVAVGSTAGVWPGGVGPTRWYWVVNPTSNTLQLSLTSGGGAITLTSAVSGFTIHKPSNVTDSTAWVKYTGVTTSANKVVKTAHGFTNGQRVMVQNAGTAAGLSAWTAYVVTNATANDFQLFSLDAFAKTAGTTVLTFSNGTGLTVSDCSNDVRSFLENLYDRVAACPTSGAGSCLYLNYFWVGTFSSSGTNNTNLKFFAPVTYRQMFAKSGVVGWDGVSSTGGRLAS